MAKTPKTPAANNHNRLLILDDDQSHLNAMARCLRQTAYDLTLTTQPETALEHLSRTDYAVFLCDQRLPGAKGTELLEQARHIAPRTIRILITAYTDTQPIIDAINRGAVYRFISKPWDDHDLRLTINQAVELYRIAGEKQQAETALKTAHTELERQVAKRTAELTQTNRQLLQEIEERKILEQRNREQREQLILADKMRTLGVLVAGMAHEINNPNQFIMLNAPLLRKIFDGIMPTLDEHLARHGDFAVGRSRYSLIRKKIPDLLTGITDGAKRIRHIVASLKDYARNNPADCTQPLEINTVVKSAVNLMDNLIKKSTRNFTAHYDERLPVMAGDPQRIEQVILNLLQNACEALADQQNAIEIRTQYDHSAGQATITIRDQGRGISPGDLQHITDPFFTTKRHTGGTGLGLAISLGIVLEHKGRLDFESSPNQGTTAVITLPALQ